MDKKTLKEIAKDHSTGFYKPVIFGLIIGAIVTFVLLILMAVILTVKDFPESAAITMSSIALGLGAMAAGFAASKKMGKKGLMTGVVTGLFLYIIVMLVSLLISKGGFSLNTFIKFAIVILASAIGGIGGVNTKKSKKYI